MITYFTGSTFNEVISSTLKEIDQILYVSEVSNEIDFAKYIKQNITKFESVDILLLDISATRNTDEEIDGALDMIRTMYDNMRIIILAAYRLVGDELLQKCFDKGIYNIINTDDFLQIKQELIQCIKEGKSYKEAIKYKNTKLDKLAIKHEVKKAVYKRLIGITGASHRIGTTHNAIVLANYFRKQGFMVALVEMNESGAFAKIRECYEEKMFEEGYFTINGVDYYEDLKPDRIVAVMEHSYNVILIDFGIYTELDKFTFERCENKFIICGAKPWEEDYVGNNVFSSTTVENLMKYIWMFNFTPEKERAEIKANMKQLKNVHFLKYTIDPFSNSDFSDADTIFADCLPDKVEPEKKGILSLIKRGKKGEPKTV